MREIKFRAWHKKNKKMYLVDELFFGVKQGEGIVTIWLGDEERDECFNASFDEVELMQFTGLKDKNGKEIYEGDIVEYRDEDTKTDDPELYRECPVSSIGVVVWDEDGFMVDGKRIGKVIYSQSKYPDEHDLDFYSYDGAEFSWKYLEIIGNIFQDKELFEWKPPTVYEQFVKDPHQRRLLRIERLKLTITEWLARKFNIHLDW